MSPFFAASQISISGSGTVSTLSSGWISDTISSEELDDSPDEQKLNKSKNDNIYSEEIKLNAYYTYDKNYNKVYDTKGIAKRFRELVKKLK